jgi:hypothetical protein
VQRVQTTSRAFRSFLIFALLAVGLHLCLEMAVLLCLDQSQCVAKTLVLDDRNVADSLILAENAVGKNKPPGTYLQSAIWKIVDVDVLATQISEVAFRSMMICLRSYDKASWLPTDISELVY